MIAWRYFKIYFPEPECKISRRQSEKSMQDRVEISILVCLVLFTPNCVESLKL